MSEVKGRAGFRAEHTKAGGKYPDNKKTGTPSSKGGSNLAIAKEALRSLDAAQSAREAVKNPNILVSEEWRNENWVSDGVGSMKVATRFEEVVESIAARNAQLYRAQAAKDYELSLLVVHLPENMCVVDPVNVSYVMRTLDDGSEEQVISEVTGEPLTKPRLIPRDADEARRYFDDALAFMVERGLIAGGMEAMHFRSDQYSEHRPHMQIGFDNYAADPKHPGHLRTFHGETWFTHDTVRYPDGHPKAGKKIGGSVKLSNYHEQMREFMTAKGWPVEKDINPKTKGNSQGKDLYAATDDARIIAEDRLAAAKAQEEGIARRARDVERALIAADANCEQAELEMIAEQENTANAMEEYLDAERAIVSERRREDDALHFDRVNRYKAAKERQSERDQELDAREADIAARSRNAVQRGYSEGIERANAAATARLRELREEDEQKVNAAMAEAKAKRAALDSGLNELKALDDVVTFGGVTVKQRRLKIAQGVNIQIEAQDSAPSVTPQQPGYESPFER